MYLDAKLIQFLVCSTAVDALVAWAVLLSVPIRPLADQSAKIITIRRIGAALIGGSGAFAIKLPFFYARGLNVFGLINLLYTDLVILLPLTGLLLLFWQKKSESRFSRRLTRGATIAALLSLLAIPIGVYASWVEPYRLQLERADLQISPSRTGKSPIRVAVLADIQVCRITEYEMTAIDRVMALKPDIILLPGDVFQGLASTFEEEVEKLQALLGRLDAPAGVFLVRGDVDWNHDFVERMIEKTHIRLLENEIVQTRFADREIRIGGIELRFDSQGAQSTVTELNNAPGDGDIRILLAHRPDVVLEMAPHSRIDAVIAGHTHGGQVVVPFYGPPMTLSNVPRHVAAGGLHRINENAIYVSRGVGCERGQAPRIRFLCPPEISLLTVGSEGKSR